ncbi:structural maintenance of chromosomes protein 2 [Artemisia annua]|uniref:Structural maintenance of chromosomes protein 2 n=1 Tax=Artemisia annua TaxID=35608 RepID=A0A2U1M539_ARTAN|nr:structural maintenance of chromosomes protein 2 [Artemisia annua]
MGSTNELMGGLKTWVCTLGTGEVQVGSGFGRWDGTVMVGGGEVMAASWVKVGSGFGRWDGTVMVGGGEVMAASWVKVGRRDHAEPPLEYMNLGECDQLCSLKGLILQRVLGLMVATSPCALAVVPMAYAIGITAGAKKRIKSKPVQPQVQKAVVELVGEGNAEVALLLVGYANEVKIAMEFVFVDTFFCKTNYAAKKKCDVFQPGGVMTGGSIKLGGDKLRQLHEKRLSENKAKQSKYLTFKFKLPDFIRFIYDN